MKIVSSCFILALFLIVDGSGEEKCRKLLLNSNVSEPSVTRIDLSRDTSCHKGNILWSSRISSSSSHIVQFTKNHNPFSLCLQHYSSEAADFTISQLKEKAKREIGRRGGEECIRSHCNHLSLLIESKSGLSTHKLSYTLHPNNGCPRCSDSCMEKILCNSDYIFIGTVRKSSLVSDNSSLYKSLVEVGNFIKYNNTYTLDSGKKTCTSSPTVYALNSDYTIPLSGIVSVFGKCELREGERYFIGTNLKLGYLSKPRLMLGCAQEDVSYMLYHLNKVLLHNTNSCC